MSYQILYSLYIIATIVFGGVYIIGPFTLRHIAVIVMIVYAIYHKYSLPIEKTMTVYILFVVFFGFSSISYGYGSEFLKAFIANYLVCYVSFWASKILIFKEKSYRAFIYTFIIIGIISSILVILQYHNVYWAFIIPDILRTFTEEDMDQLSSIGGIISGQSLPGLFNRVDNGYYLSIATILSLYLYSKSKKIISLTVWGFLMISLYMVQQRAAMIAGLLLSIIFLSHILTKSHKRIIFSIIAIFVVIILFNNIDYSLLEGSRYSLGADTGTRQELWKISYDYIVNHPFDANAYEFNKLHPDIAAHNLFLNAFLSCGIIGGSIVLYVVAVLCWRCYKMFKARNFIKPEYYLTSLAFLSFNFISLTHNNSVVNGNIVFWILATPLMLKVYNKKSK